MSNFPHLFVDAEQPTRPRFIGLDSSPASNSMDATPSTHSPPSSYSLMQSPSISLSQGFDNFNFDSPIHSSSSRDSQWSTSSSSTSTSLSHSFSVMNNAHGSTRIPDETTMTGYSLTNLALLGDESETDSTPVQANGGRTSFIARVEPPRHTRSHSFKRKDRTPLGDRSSIANSSQCEERTDDDCIVKPVAETAPAKVGGALSIDVAHPENDFQIAHFAASSRLPNNSNTSFKLLKDNNGVPLKRSPMLRSQSTPALGISRPDSPSNDVENLEMLYHSAAEDPEYSLPCSPSGDRHQFISCDTMAALMEGKYRDCINHFIVIDCRYDYEYNGGHIINAHNFHFKRHIESLYNDNKHFEGKIAFIFHCEFSQKRGPRAFRLFRNMDRDGSLFPTDLSFPDCYVLKGGYKEFYKKYPQYCTQSGGYIPMDDENFFEVQKDRRKKEKDSWNRSNTRGHNRRSRPATGRGRALMRNYSEPTKFFK